MSDKIFDHLIHAFEAPLTNPVLIFSLVLFIILLSPILLRPIKVPGIIGLIISGMIIGPHGLNWLEKNSAVDLFSTIGLLYIMFIAGLELDMNEFKKTKHKSFLFGFFTFIIPISIGFPVCYYVLDYSLLTSILIASMFATHTLVSYPIVNRYGISKNEAVAITIGGTILTDTAVLIILAVIKGASQGDIDNEFWVTLGISFAIFLFIMFGVIPKIAKWFFEKVESEKTGHYIFVLTVVFFAAFLAEMANLEPIIGAFVAGLALNKLIPHSSALMNRIEFIGNAIFIPFFLISVGMIVDIGVITNSSGLTVFYVAGALTLVGIVGKFLAATATQWAFKYSTNERNLIFGLSNAHAAATLAIIMVGYNNDIIDENVLNGTIILILVSCIIASIVTENASKKIVLEGRQHEEHMEHVEEHEEQIVIPIANLNNMEAILDFATLVKSKKSPHPLNILSVVPNDEQAERNLNQARQNLDKTAKYASGSETEVDLITKVDFNIANGISRAAREAFADCLILGWPSATSFVEKIVGEKTESILNRTDATLMMCRIEKPFITNKMITVFVPPLAESEVGFAYWMEKITKLASELSLPIIFVCNHRSHQAIEQMLENLKSSVPVSFENYEDWDNIYGLATFSNAESMLVFVSARYGDVSYRDSLDGLAKRVGKYYKNQNLLLIFPSRLEDQHIDEYEDIQTAPIFRRISREIGNMFSKDK
ncbi:MULTISPECIES: cation:proton antiporter [Sphingobacterium]|nr:MULTISPECIES: cation:proton antiporter [Sphingobacterium]MBA8986480.1 Kef-type K+ transport system membrane component KefB [Sphingobacterium soli]OYD42641.1 sodium:proton antiporter [Sphingobacterium cellulitidis]OYD44594.1 sodium:proton antiporter [Sphingobacterium cellulitidis]WFB61963.1 cation:proton antiporter [Sphingobacterium sp. WM]